MLSYEASTDNGSPPANMVSWYLALGTHTNTLTWVCIHTWSMCVCVYVCVHTCTHMDACISDFVCGKERFWVPRKFQLAFDINKDKRLPLLGSGLRCCHYTSQNPLAKWAPLPTQRVASISLPCITLSQNPVGAACKVAGSPLQLLLHIYSRITHIWDWFPVISGRINTNR